MAKKKIAGKGAYIRPDGTYVPNSAFANRALQDKMADAAVALHSAIPAMLEGRGAYQFFHPDPVVHAIGSLAMPEVAHAVAKSANKHFPIVGHGAYDLSGKMKHAAGKIQEFIHKVRHDAIPAIKSAVSRAGTRVKEFIVGRRPLPLRPEDGPAARAARAVGELGGAAARAGAGYLAGRFGHDTMGPVAGAIGAVVGQRGAADAAAAATDRAVEMGRKVDAAGAAAVRAVKDAPKNIAHALNPKTYLKKWQDFQQGVLDYSNGV